MRTEFDISSIYRDVFGLPRGKKFDVSAANDTGIRTEIDFTDIPPNNDNEGVNFLELRETVNRRDHMGRPIFMPVRIGGVWLPNEPTMTLTSRKNIVETALVGSTRRGTVKELIALEDWMITIQGIAINTQSRKVYPEDEVNALNKLYERNEALEIESALTNLLGITRVVIKSFELVEMVGIQHAQGYRFEMVSDEDFILDI